MDSARNDFMEPDAPNSRAREFSSSTPWISHRGGRGSARRSARGMTNLNAVLSESETAPGRARRGCRPDGI